MDKLTLFQQKIVDECIAKRRGCMSVPMGSGKTLMALTLAQQIGGDTLIVVSKTLIESWKSEISKFFDDDLKYEIYHSCALNKQKMESFKPSCSIVITTPDMLSRRYTELSIRNFFRTQEYEPNHRTGRTFGNSFGNLINRYHVPSKPFLDASNNGTGSFLFSTAWKCIIVDEVQTYTTASSLRCQAISSIHSEYRLMLSGTPINEPTAERVLGYHLMIGDSTFPNCVSETDRFMRKDFKGFASTMVTRTMEDVDFTLPQCTEHIIEHTLSSEENTVYQSLKSIISSIKAKIQQAKEQDNTTSAKKYRAYLLSMLTYTRQFLVCPLVPYATMAIEMMNDKNENELVKTFKEEISKLNLDHWFSDPNASRSSRINAVLKVANKRINDKLIVFNCFRTSLNVLASYFPEDRPQFIISSEQSPSKRAKTMSRFESSSNGVLFLTYELVAEGLINLQHAHVVLLVDVWWNCGKTQQAIARVLRRGQTNPVDVYFFTSNTGIEKGLFTKHSDKLAVLNELKTGPAKSTVKTLAIKNILSLLADKHTNTNLLRGTRATVAPKAVHAP